jgi:hypothetical protein
MPLTLPNPLWACRSFCENDHKFQGLYTGLLKPVENPLYIGADLIFVKSTRRYSLVNK